MKWPSLALQLHAYFTLAVVLVLIHFCLDSKSFVHQVFNGYWKIEALLTAKLSTI